MDSCRLVTFNSFVSGDVDLMSVWWVDECIPSMCLSCKEHATRDMEKRDEPLHKNLNAALLDPPPISAQVSL
jgi:hypothetical protein